MGLGCKRAPHAEETKVKISLAMKGNKNGKGGKGRKHSEEARSKMRATKLTNDAINKAKLQVIKKELA